MSSDLDAVVAAGLDAVEGAADLAALDAAVSGVLGRKGTLTGVKRTLGTLDSDARRDLGKRINEAQARLTEAVDARREVLADERDRVTLAAVAVDVTLPPRTPARGSLHPVLETMEAIVDAAVGLGYGVLRGPEVESDWFNFDALNTPPDHPARSLQDTIYVRPLRDGDPAESTLLRTQTSPMQARALLERDPPLYVVVPGRVYRQDTPDATHLPAFHQVEGLAVDADLSMADLRGTLGALARTILGDDVELRFRPHYFPFTEPSAELDARLGGRWIELLGSGMVHPNVLRAVGHDPERVRGFAFGIGVERVAMVRHGVTDLRSFAESDVRFLAAF